MDKDLLKEMDRVAYDFSNNWYRDLFRFKGVSLGVLDNIDIIYLDKMKNKYHKI